MWQDLRYGARMLVKSPGFALAAVVTLALGVGANTAIFSLISAVLLRPLPFKDPDRLVLVWERRASSGDANIPISAHEFMSWREQNRVFERAAIYVGGGYNLSGAGEPETVDALNVSADYFSVLGVPPALGRAFLPQEDQAGGGRVVVLSQGLWRRRFGGDPEIVGRAITLSDQSYTVVGVMPALESEPDLWTPIDLPRAHERMGAHNHVVVARLKSGVTPEQAQADVAGIARQLERQFPSFNVGHGVQVVPLHEEVVGNIRRALLILCGAVGCVLLIACANVANLLLTRAATRQKEMAVRTALGASRPRLIRQSLTESLLLAALGGGVGLLFAFWAIDLLPAFGLKNIPRLEKVRLDSLTLAATAGSALLTGIITGLAPAWRGSRPDLNEWLNEAARSSAGLSRRRVGNLLVMLEVALALVLLVGAGLLARSFARLMSVDPGFNPDHVLTVNLSLPGQRYPKEQKQARFYDQVMERLRELPGVDAVGATSQLPLAGGDSWLPYTVEGRPAPPPGQEPYAAYRIVSPDYFRSLSVPLRRGRFFTGADARNALPLIRWYEKQPDPPRFSESQPMPVVIVNETLARQLWPGEDPIGRRIKAVYSPWLTVIGVVGDVRHTTLAARPNPEMYLLHLQEPQASMRLTVRTSGDPLRLAAAVRERVRALDQDLPLGLATMEQIVTDSVGRQRFNLLLLGSLGAAALLLAVVGVFGVVNYSVAQRTHEIGIRVALGAQERDVLGLVIRQGMTPALLGVALGVAGSLALTRWMQELLYGVSATDPLTFALVALLLTLVALAACYLPARRAARVDPLVALRQQ